jgi:hypothetical protein
VRALALGKVEAEGSGVKLSEGAGVCLFTQLGKCEPRTDRNRDLHCAAECLCHWIIAVMSEEQVTSAAYGLSDCRKADWHFITPAASE